MNKEINRPLYPALGKLLKPNNLTEHVANSCLVIWIQPEQL